MTGHEHLNKLAPRDPLRTEQVSERSIREVRVESPSCLPTGISDLTATLWTKMHESARYLPIHTVVLVVLALFSSLLAQVTPTAAGAQDKVDAYGCDIARSPGRDVIVRSNDELSNAIRSRQPGDDIQIATNRRLRAISMNSGTAGQPKNWITVRAADGFKPRIRARGHLGVDVRVPVCADL